MSVSNTQVLSWIAYQNVSADLPLSTWHVGDVVYSSVSKILATSWKTGFTAERFVTFEWNIKQISKSIEVSWVTNGDNSVRRGNPICVVSANHTGEGNSDQVIRFRSVKDITKVVFESPAESSQVGLVLLTLTWDPKKQDAIYIKPFLYSDLDLVSGKYNLLRPDVKLSVQDFPVYAFHEYKSTTDLTKAVRYLGYIVTPYNYTLTPQNPYSIEEVVDYIGYYLFPANRTNQILTVTFRQRDGKTISGSIPPEAAMVVLKSLDEAGYRVGYIPGDDLPVYSSDGTIIDVSYLKKYFIAFGDPTAPNILQPTVQNPSDLNISKVTTPLPDDPGPAFYDYPMNYSTDPRIFTFTYPDGEVVSVEVGQYQYVRVLKNDTSVDIYKMTYDPTENTLTPLFIKRIR